MVLQILDGSSDIGFALIFRLKVSLAQRLVLSDNSILAKACPKANIIEQQLYILFICAIVIITAYFEHLHDL
jgi:hypothetical protein